MSAAFAAGLTRLSLEFDRAITLAGYSAGQMSIDDGAGSGSMWVDNAIQSQLTPTTVRVNMGATIPSFIPVTTLTAGAGTGIAAVDDGGTWAGVVSLPLPFP